MRWVATSITLMTKSSSSVAIISFPSGVKKASSGVRKLCPGARSPGRGNSQVTRPCGSTTIRRLLLRSAISTGAGSTEGSDPADRAGALIGLVNTAGTRTPAAAPVEGARVELDALDRAPAGPAEELVVAPGDDPPPQA